MAKKINAKKGDVVLTTHSPLTYETIKNLGAFWGHCGMVMDDKGTTIRHCNFHPSKLEMEWHNILGVNILPKRFVPRSLTSALPGFLTQTIEEAFFSQIPDFMEKDGFVLRPLPENEEKYRPLLHKIADKMANMDGYYKLNACVNILQYEETNKRKIGKGTIGSGAVYFAHKFCGKEMNLAELTKEQLRRAADNVVLYFMRVAKDQYGVFGSSLLNVTEIGTKMVNQVINTYFADRGHDTTGWWTKNYKEGTTIAPDHLLPIGIKNPDGNAIGIQDENSSYYGEIVPVKVSES